MAETTAWNYYISLRKLCVDCDYRPYYKWYWCGSVCVVTTTAVHCEGVSRGSYMLPRLHKLGAGCSPKGANTRPSHQTDSLVALEPKNRDLRLRANRDWGALQCLCRSSVAVYSAPFTSSPQASHLRSHHNATELSWREFVPNQNQSTDISVALAAVPISGRCLAHMFSINTFTPAFSDHNFLFR